MIGKIPTRSLRLGATILVALGALMISVATASAAEEVIYNNLNTVATTVNGFPNQDTFSQSYGGGGVTSVGNVLSFAGFDRKLRKVTTEIDSFKCEKGEYQYENCYSKPGKHFRYPLTLRVYEINPGFSRSHLIGQHTETFKMPYRPTTDVHCPATPEGKGFGNNCDVGGVLSKITFKLAGITVPQYALLEVRNATPEEPINLGLEEAYKGYNTTTDEFEGVPGTYTPAVGFDPLGKEKLVLGCEDPPSPFCNAPEDSGIFGGYEGALPVFEVMAKE